MADGKYSSILREKFKVENPNKQPITKAGKLTKDYEAYLTENCTPHWASTLSSFAKKVPDIEAGKIKPQKALDEAKRETILAEKCSIGIGGRLSAQKKKFESKYNIKF